MWIIKKIPATGDPQMVAMKSNIEAVNDVVVWEGGHKLLYHGHIITDCKRARCLGETLVSIKYENGLKANKVYGDLWVIMDHGRQLWLGKKDDCDFAVIDVAEDALRSEMTYKGLYEDCTYTAVWVDDPVD